MRKQILLFLCFVFVSAIAVPAQSKRTVTNADLEKFRQKRVQAETEYRQNYQRLGLPSPEELEKQREKNRQELSMLSARLQNESAERERSRRDDELRQAQIQYFRSNSYRNDQSTYNGNGYYSSGYFGGFPYYGYPGGYYNNYYNNGFGRNGSFGRENFYNPISPGTPFSSQGVRINNRGLRINITGGNRPPVRIRNRR
jgi:hypothetical protein